MSLPQNDNTEVIESLLLRWDVARENGCDVSVSELCRDHPELAAEISERIDALREIDVLLTPADTRVARLTGPASGPAIGTKLGKYKLLQKLGEGGMGSVYMADQTEPVVRRVALKVIRPGMDSREILARFEAERQALAMMDHPNIAKVLDAGTTEDGHPYFVMELVKGLPVTKYCDEKRLPTKKRLELFISICHGVGHAHQKGVIHRDIKPSNVLVAEYDHISVPKIIDFGVAKATTHRLTDKTLFTLYGQIVGTLEYMSPEQAKFNQLDIDTRSDIYSLGVLLYELLVGIPPFDRERLRSGALDEVLRIIREEEPPKPSTRLTGSDQSSRCAADRRAEPAKLTRLIRGDLDWIVMKALAKERSDRYQHATDFSADIERHLRDEPIEARRPSVVGHARRFIRRHKLSVALGSLAAFAVVAAVFSIAFAWFKQINAEISADRLVREEVFRFASASEAIAAQQPTESVALAIKAVERSRDSEGPMLPIAHQALLNAAQRLDGSQVLSRDVALKGVTIQQEWMIAVGNDKLHLWDLRVDNPASTYRVVGGEEDLIQTMQVSHDGRVLVTSGKRLLYWNLEEFESLLEPVQLADEINVDRLSLSPKGRSLVACTHQGDLLMWDLKTPNHPPRNLGRPGEELKNLLTGLESRYVVLEFEGLTQIWNTELEEPATAPITLTSSAHEKFSLRSISPSGQWLVTAAPGACWLWDLLLDDPSQSPRVIHYPEGNHWEAVNISTNDRWLFLTEPIEGTIHKTDLSILQDGSDSVSSLLKGHSDLVRTMATDSTGNVLASAGRDGTIRVWDLRNGETAGPIHILQGFDIGTDIVDATLDQNSRWVAAIGTDSTLRLWDLHTNKVASSGLVLQVAASERIPLTRLAVSSDGRWIARSGGESSSYTTRLWKVPVRPDMRLSEVEVYSFTGRLADISGDDHWILTCNGNGTFSLGDLKSGNPEHHQQLLGAPEKSSDAFYAATFAGSGRYVFAGDLGTELRLWDLTADDIGASEQKLSSHKKPVLRLAKSVGGGSVVSCDADQMLVWDVDQLGRRDLRGLGVGLDERQKSPSFGVHVLAAAVPRGDKLGTIFLWDLRPHKSTSTPREIAKPANVDNPYLWLVRISPDGRWLFTHPYYGQAFLWDLSEADPKPLELENVYGSQWAAFSPDGRWLATSNRQGTAQLWDLTAPDVQSSIRILRGHDGPIWAVAFSGNSKWLVTDSTDGTVRRWNLDTDWLIDYSRTR